MQRNSLMEWIDQIKKMSKSIDYICLDAIDSIVKVLPYIDRSLIKSHRVFFNRFCDYYHKPNPCKIWRTVQGKKKIIRAAMQLYRNLRKHLFSAASRHWRTLRGNGLKLSTSCSSARSWSIRAPLILTSSTR